MRCRREVTHVHYAAVDVQLDRLEREPDVDLDAVDVAADGTAIEAVPLEDDAPVLRPLLDVVRPCAVHRSADALRVDRQGPLSGEERHRQAGEEVRRPLRQAERERVATRHDPAGPLSAAGDDCLGADDIFDERLRRRAHPPVQGPVQRAGEALRVDALPVAEPVGALELERVDKPVTRDAREALSHLGREPRPSRGGRMRVVQEHRAGRVPDRPGRHVVPESRIDVVDVDRQAVLERPADPCLPGVRCLGPGATRGARYRGRREQPGADEQHRHRERESSMH